MCFNLKGYLPDNHPSHGDIKSAKVFLGGDSKEQEPDRESDHD